MVLELIKLPLPIPIPMWSHLPPLLAYSVSLLKISQGFCGIMHLNYWSFPGILCSLHQNATLVAEKAHAQRPQKPNGGKVVKKGAATKVLHEQKIDTSRVYNIQHTILTDSPKIAINSQESLTRCTRKPKNSKDFNMHGEWLSQISLKMSFFFKTPENPSNSWDFGSIQHINLTDSPQIF